MRARNAHNDGGAWWLAHRRMQPRARASIAPEIAAGLDRDRAHAACDGITHREPTRTGARTASRFAALAALTTPSSAPAGRARSRTSHQLVDLSKQQGQ